MGKYYLYALLKDNKAIYVGVTNQIKNRINNHRGDKEFDKYKIIKTYNNKKEALIAENAIIRFNGMFDIGLINAKHQSDYYYNLIQLK